VGGQKTLRTYWRNYFEQTDALLWVVDSADAARLQVRGPRTGARAAGPPAPRWAPRRAARACCARWRAPDRQRVTSVVWGVGGAASSSAAALTSAASRGATREPGRARGPELARRRPRVLRAGRRPGRTAQRGPHSQGKKFIRGTPFDAAPRQDCRAELHGLLREEKLAGASLLILANKQDLPGALTGAQIEQARARERPPRVGAASATPGVKGVSWVPRAARREAACMFQPTGACRRTGVSDALMSVAYCSVVESALTRLARCHNRYSRPSRRSA